MRLRRADRRQVEKVLRRTALLREFNNVSKRITAIHAIAKLVISGWFVHDNAAELLQSRKVSPDVVAVKTKVPDARLIYLMRHPLERMRSMYLHQVADGRERRPIGVALASDRDYLRTSMYGMQVAAYRAHFPAEQLLLLESEDLRDRREATLRRILEFIGADPDVVPGNVADEPNRAADRRIPNLAGALLGRSDAYVRLRERSTAVTRVNNRLLTRGVKDAAIPARTCQA